MHPEAVMALGLFAGIASVCWSAAFAWGKWLQYRRHQETGPHDLAQRLDRIESAIDTVAIEVERLGEGQRFTVKLLRDASKGPTDPKPPRANTPH
jgi:hypothetical protein